MLIRFLMFVGSLVFLGLVLLFIVVVPDKQRVSGPRSGNREMK
jgi:hypothetical protein